ncbi:unnamed protein product [Spirodela intermedia]|uniref:UBN2 domain-containing protein n=1 Tax=Spirodela intermedia TaxID=51605 RepID=A0ABN7E8C8_SPIIN|nr:unnamed protein product [Spirodela intermedia]
MKFTKIVSELCNLVRQEEKDVVCRFLRATPSKFDALTLSLKQYSDLANTMLDEVIGSLSIHKLRLKDWSHGRRRVGITCPRAKQSQVLE